ncbi:hypothetical protein LTR65_005793 [Meristemomyces frigidus]
MPLAIVVRIFRRLFRIFGWTFFVQYRPPPEMVNLDDAGMPGPAFAGFFDN